MKICQKMIAVCFILGIVLLSGCGSQKPLTYPAIDLAGRPEATPAPEPEYVLGYGDQLEVKFFRNPQFNETVTVRPDGRISLQRVGDIYVAGMTAAHLDEEITRVYNEILVEPDITVIVRTIASHKFYVLGEVERPGGYPVERDMTVLQTLATAGGPKMSGQLKNVIILRQRPDRTVEPILVNISGSMKKDLNDIDTRRDIRIQARDIVYVPKTAIASISSFMKQIYDGLLPPVDLYLRAILFYDR